MAMRAALASSALFLAAQAAEVAPTATVMEVAHVAQDGAPAAHAEKVTKVTQQSSSATGDWQAGGKNDYSSFMQQGGPSGAQQGFDYNQFSQKYTQQSSAGGGQTGGGGATDYSKYYDSYMGGSKGQGKGGSKGQQGGSKGQGKGGSKGQQGGSKGQGKGQYSQYFSQYMGQGQGDKTNAAASSVVALAATSPGGGDYSQYTKMGGGGDYQEYTKMGGDYKKYMNMGGSTGGDYKEYMDYSKYMNMGGQSKPQDSKADEKEAATDGPGLSLLAMGGAGAASSASAGTSPGGPGDFKQYLTQSGGGNYQQYMSQADGYMNGNYMKQGGSSYMKSGGNYQQYMKQADNYMSKGPASDYKQYYANYFGGDQRPSQDSVEAAGARATGATGAELLSAPPAAADSSSTQQTTGTGYDQYYKQYGGAYAPAMGQNSSDQQAMAKHYMDQYAGQYAKGSMQQQQRAQNSLPKNAADCKTMKQLKAWRESKLANVKQWVPAGFQANAEGLIEDDFKKAKVALLANQTQTETTEATEETAAAKPAPVSADAKFDQTAPSLQGHQLHKASSGTERSGTSLRGSNATAAAGLPESAPAVAAAPVGLAEERPSTSSPGASFVAAALPAAGCIFLLRTFYHQRREQQLAPYEPLLG